MDLYSDGDRYDALTGAEAPNAEVAFYCRLARGAPSRTVLELGCGTGRLSVPMARDGLRVTGIDLSEPMLSTARTKAAKAGLRVRFIAGDIRGFDLDQRFDLILLPSNAVAHLEDEGQVESCLRCVVAHLGPEATFVLHAFNPRDEFLNRHEEARTEVGRFVDAASVSWVVSESGHYDAQRKTQILRWRWDASDGQQFETQMRLRMFSSEELDAAIKAAGLAVVDRRGEFSGGPFTQESRHQILTLVKDKSVALVGQEIAISLGSVAMSINGPDRSEINDFVGQSQTRRLPDGRIEIAVQGSPHRGARNEPQVRKVLQDALSIEWGVNVIVEPPTKQEDARGIDGTTVAPDGRVLVVQIVTVPADCDYARCVAKGSHQVALTIDEATGWIENAIRHKLTIAPADRGLMILALDVRHAGFLAASDIVAAAQQRLAPAKFGFAEVWLVANVPTHSARLA
jgi:2-polyprenyl-3-methyl-5-hydroxy-6-metoxy-1,4-benzoquinol methylase